MKRKKTDEMIPLTNIAGVFKAQRCSFLNTDVVKNNLKQH